MELNPSLLALICLSLVVSWPSLCAASSSLRGGPAFPSDHVSLEEVQRSVLDEINEALGITHLDDHIERIEAELLPIYTALPKNSQDFLGHTAVRYALHRLFVEKKGWFFRGLEPDGGTWNSSSPTELLKDRVPAYIQSLIEEQLDGRGFTLHELTVLAASLEHLAKNEAESRLRAAYEALDMSQEGSQPEVKVDEALDLFMMDFMIGGNFTVWSAAEVNEKKKSMKATHPKWEQIQALLRDVRRRIVAEASVDEKQVDSESGISFALAIRIAAEVGQHLGRWQDTQCTNLKDQLLALGERQAGRVLLSDFYRAALDGSVRGEHIDYLRKLGALDETVPGKPTVVVSNYINSPTNCIASSSFYSVCCMNECEGILRSIEQSIAGPLARPDDIEKLVTDTKFTTVSTPREFSTTLRDRLQQIARQHDGQIPLHGRLFSQWLHHAYPRECPYPHTAGSTRPQTPDEWMMDSGRESSSTHEEMRAYVTSAQGTSEPQEKTLVEQEELPWSNDEELFCVLPPTSTSEAMSHQRESPRSGRSLLRGIFFVVALTSMLWMMKEQLVGAVGAVRTTKKQGLPMKVFD